jgi:hypothetical protein
MSKRPPVLATVLLLSSGFLSAQVPPEERLPLTDPDRLESLGFPRDATNVFVWSKANAAAPSGSPAVTAIPARAAESWGTQAGFSTVNGYELVGATSNTLLHSSLASGTYCDDLNSKALTFATADVPDGATLETVTWFGSDTLAAASMTLSVWESCLGFSAPYLTPVVVQLDSFSTAGIDGSFSHFRSLPAIGPKKSACQYVVQVVFADNASVNCLGSFGAQLRFRKAMLGWYRSPGEVPNHATFGDVPTTHPYFRAIELLNASGITQGCGGGNFCPGANVTRGEMAAFLARALGLQEP